MTAPTYDVSASVFLPGLMGAGILLSGGILLADGIKRLTPNRGVRRRVAVAKAVHGVVEGAARAAGTLGEPCTTTRGPSPWPC